MKPNYTKLLLYTFAILLGLQSANAQPVNFEKGENAYDYLSTLHLNKPFYTTGEYIWFKLYLPIEHKGKNTALRASLYDTEMIVHQQFFMMTEGKPYAYGYFKIPFDWQTGIYTLSVSAIEKETRENVHLMNTSNVCIYNDLQIDTTAIELIQTPSKHPIPDDKDIKNNQIQIRVESKEVNAMQMVEANIEVKDYNGNRVEASLSVAIRDWNLTYDSISNASIRILGAGQRDSTVVLSDQIHLWYETEKPMENNVMSAFLPDEHQFLYPTKDSKGRLLLEMPPFEGEKKLQFLSLIPEDVKIKKKEPSLIQFGFATSIEYSPNILYYLEQSRLRKKIYQLYGTTESNPTIPVISSTKQSLPTPNRSLRLADYEYFPTLPVFLKEVSTALKYRKAKKDSYAFKMFNATPGKRVFHNGLPIFVVDGQVTRNSDFIAGIDVNEMDSLHLFYYDKDLKKHFGAMGRSGMAYLTTKSKELKVPAEDHEDIFRVNGVQTLPDFPVFQDFEEKGLPRFSPVIYWHPNLQSDAKGNCKFSFQHGHDKGVFVIEVIGQTIEGDVISSQIFYEVK